MIEPQSGITFGVLIADALSRYGDRTAFVQDERTMSYFDAASLASRMQQVFESKGGVRGSTIAALSVNVPEVWLARAATYLNGARYTGAHPMGSIDDHVDLCNDAEISILIVHPKFAESGMQIAARASSVKHVLTLGPAEHGEDLLALCEEVEARELTPLPGQDEEDIATLTYTGGSTGKPKGVMISQRAMVQQIQSVAASWRLPLDPRTLISTPITHAGSIPILPTLLRGGTVVLQQSFSPAPWLQAVQTHRINFAFTVPTLLYTLLDFEDLGNYDVSSFETLIYGSSPMAPARIVEAQTVFGATLLQVYGQTESLGMVSALLPAEHDSANRPGLLTSCGRPVVGTMVEVLDSSGAPVEEGVVGEICVRSRSVMSGYWKRPDETAEVLKGGWFWTGDMAYRDGEGFLHIVDRRKDMVITGGFNVYPREIEDVLTDDPTVSAAAVIGVPHEKWGEAVHAFVVARPGMTPDVENLIATVKQRKGSHHAPKTLELISELPVTKVGKIDKQALRASYWEGSARAVN